MKLKTLMALCSAACLLGATAQASFTVQANQAWQDSGMAVAAGQSYTITASGEWTGGALGTYGPVGTTWAPGYNMWVDGPHWGALVVSIGGMPGTIPPYYAVGDALPASVPFQYPFLTGNSVTFTAGASGNLFFTINDDASGGVYSDNSGQMTVTAVPEPSTVLAGALLLLPFGASTLRSLRRKA